MKHHPSRKGLTDITKAGPVWNGRVTFNEAWLDLPLRWKKPRRIFVAAHGDLFHENVPDEWIDRVFAVMAMCEHHVFQVLTKRPARMRAYLSAKDRPEKIGWAEHGFCPGPVRSEGRYHGPQHLRLPLENVWLGFSAEDQIRLSERWKDAGPLAESGWLVWCSAEPLLGPLDFTRVETIPDRHGIYGLARCGIRIDTLTGRHHESGIIAPGYKLSWIVAGGESGPGARPMHPDWARSLRDQCQAAGVPFFFKQWGEWAPGEHVERQRGIVETATWWCLSSLRGGGADCWSFESEDMAVEGGHRDDEPDLYRVGKKAAGRLLDGREHSEFPA